jgi:hypothetical protein
MAYKHMKKLPTSLAIKEMQMQMTLRFHLNPVKIVNIKKTKAGKDARRMEGPLYTTGGNVN